MAHNSTVSLLDVVSHEVQVHPNPVSRLRSDTVRRHAVRAWGVVAHRVLSRCGVKSSEVDHMFVGHNGELDVSVGQLGRELGSSLELAAAVSGFDGEHSDAYMLNSVLEILRSKTNARALVLWLSTKTVQRSFHIECMGMVFGNTEAALSFKSAELRTLPKTESSTSPFEFLKSVAGNAELEGTIQEKFSHLSLEIVKTKGLSTKAEETTRLGAYVERARLGAFAVSVIRANLSSEQVSSVQERDKEAAIQLAKCVRAFDRVVLIESGSFLIVLPRTDQPECESICKRLDETLSNLDLAGELNCSAEFKTVTVRPSERVAEHEIHQQLQLPKSFTIPPLGG